MERCEVKPCRAGATVNYFGHGVCEQHWDQLTAEEAPPGALRKALGVDAPSILPMEEKMTIPTAGTRRGKRSKDQKTSSRKKAPKGTKSKKEKAPREPQVVFAFRLSKTDRDRIHQAAGSGKATQFVRAAALAAANGDATVFEQLVGQAKANLK